MPSPSVELEMPEEAYERIYEAAWNKDGCPGVVLRDTYTINACNHIYSGTIEIGGEKFGFIYESGDNRGSYVHAWGDPDEVGTYDPGPRPEQPTFVPIKAGVENITPLEYAAYMQSREWPIFKKKIGEYLYDRHFQPGIAIERHYEDWAKSQGLKIGYLSNVKEGLTNEELKETKRIAAVWNAL